MCALLLDRPERVWRSIAFTFYLAVGFNCYGNLILQGERRQHSNAPKIML